MKSVWNKSLVLPAIVAGTVGMLLGGCGSSKNNTTPVQQGVVSQIIGASSPGRTVNSQSGSLPASSTVGAAAPTVSVLAVNPVTGGGSQVVLSVTTAQPVDEILIGVPNTQGYYDVVVNPATATRSRQLVATIASTTYQVTLITTGAAASSLSSVIVETRTAGVVSQPAPVSMVLTTRAAPTGLVYTMSNLNTGNTVLAFRRDTNGNLTPLTGEPTQGYATGGFGSSSVPTDPNGNAVNDADTQLIIDRAHLRLYVVNQGSDTISAFNILSDGSLQLLPSEPTQCYSSGGPSPISLALDAQDSVLAVVNKAYAANRPVSNTPNVTTFKVNSDGSLSSPLSSQPLTASPVAPTFPAPGDATQVLFSPNSQLLFVNELFSGKIFSFVNNAGTLTPSPGSPTSPPAAAFTMNGGKPFTLGMGVNPTQNILYVNLPLSNQLAIFTFNSSGTLTYSGEVANTVTQGFGLYGDALNGGGCAMVINKTGTLLFDVDCFSAAVTVFDIGTNPTVPKEIGSSKLNGNGNSFQLQLDPTESFLYVINARRLSGVPVGTGNTLHSLKVNGSTLAESPGSPVALSAAPISLPVGTDPQVVATPGGVATL